MGRTEETHEELAHQATKPVGLRIRSIPKSNGSEKLCFELSREEIQEQPKNSNSESLNKKFKKRKKPDILAGTNQVRCSVCGANNS